jgi:hypothetical protein
LPESQEKVKINKNPDSHLLRSCSAQHLDPGREQEDEMLL